MVQYRHQIPQGGKRALKKVYIVLLCLLCVFGFCCCKKADGTADKGSESPVSTESGRGQESDTALGSETMPESGTTKETPSEDGPVTYTKAGSVLTVTLKLPEHGLEEASLLLLTDGSKQNSWKEDPSVLLDIDQVTLDEEGRATVTMTLSKAESACIVVTVGDSVYQKEVK